MEDIVKARFAVIGQAFCISVLCQDCDYAGMVEEPQLVIAAHLQANPTHRLVTTQTRTIVTRFEIDPDRIDDRAPDVPAQGKGEG